MNADASRWARIVRSTLGGYAIAIGVTALGLLARWALDPLLGDFTPFTTLYPGIAFLALFVGLWPSIASAVLGMLGATYWFIPPRGFFEVTEAAHVYGNLSFLTVCACIITAGEISRRSRAKLERAENLFESFLNNSPGAEFLKDEEGRYIYANRTTERRIGAEFVGKTDEEIFPASYAARLRSNDLTVLRANKSQEFVETTEGPDGERTWLSIKFPVVDAEGRRLIGGKAIDITQQKRAEEEARAASELLRHFVNAVPAGLTRCSRDLRYLMVNPAYAKMAGLPVERIVGQPIVDVMGAEGWGKIRPYVERVLRGERVEYEMPLRFASGGSHYIHVAYTPERDASSEVVGWVASVADITGFKTVEAQLQRVEKLAAAGQLAASLAHEINNPLSTVTNALYLLKTRSDLDDEAADLVKAAGSELERLTRIVRQSLAYYRG